MSLILGQIPTISLIADTYLLPLAVAECVVWLFDLTAQSNSSDSRLGSVVQIR